MTFLSVLRRKKGVDFFFRENPKFCFWGGGDPRKRLWFFLKKGKRARIGSVRRKKVENRTSSSNENRNCTRKKEGKAFRHHDQKNLSRRSGKKKNKQTPKGGKKKKSSPRRRKKRKEALRFALLTPKNRNSSKQIKRK